MSHINSFHYGEECLIAWNAFDVGEGKAIPWSQLQDENISCLLLLSSHHFPPVYLFIVKSKSEAMWLGARRSRPYRTYLAR